MKRWGLFQTAALARLLWLPWLIGATVFWVLGLAGLAAPLMTCSALGLAVELVAQLVHRQRTGHFLNAGGLRHD
jgi:hypothetical protein